MAELTLHTYQIPEIFNFNIVNQDNRKIEKAANSAVPWSLMSNENSLINWYLLDPINQRGQRIYSADGYTIDRWKKFSGTNTVRITDEGLAFSGNGVNSHRMIQPIENAVFLNGKSITLSALVKNPNSEFQIGIQNQTTGVLKKFSIEPSTDFTVISFTTSIAVSPNDIVNFLMYPSKTSSVYEVVVSAAKLELGDHQTLAHQDASGKWVLNDPPPDKATELAKCQRYCLVIKVTSFLLVGWVNLSGTAFHFPLDDMRKLRIKPNIIYDAFDGLGLTIDGNGMRISLTSKFCNNMIASYSSAITIPITDSTKVASLKSHTIGIWTTIENESKKIILDAEIY